MDYRNNAQKSLKRADEKLNAGNSEDLKYAALELRMAMEALTYDRALAYKDEFPPKEYETWQPRKVMSVLLEIEPDADQNCFIAAGVEKEYGTPAPAMTPLGWDKALSMNVLRKHYDALGSYLHVQSMKQVRVGKVLNVDKIHSRCKEISNLIRNVLSSPIFNITLGCITTLHCFECKRPIHKRIPDRQDEVQVECFGCSASYTIIDMKNGKVEWRPNYHNVKCANNECKYKAELWKHDLAIGKRWTCPECKGHNAFVLALQYSPEGMDKTAT